MKIKHNKILLLTLCFALVFNACQKEDKMDAPQPDNSDLYSEKGTNPEELVGAAHAGCFSMFLSALLTKAGFTPTRIVTTATVHLTDGPTISMIELNTEAEVPGLTEVDLQTHAQAAKKDCPVSKALAGGPEIQLNVKLV